MPSTVPARCSTSPPPLASRTGKQAHRATVRGRVCRCSQVSEERSPQVTRQTSADGRQTLYSKSPTLRPAFSRRTACGTCEYVPIVTAIVAQRVQEASRFFRRPHRHLLVLTLRHTHRTRRVSRQHVPPDTVGKGTVQHAVRELHGVDRQSPAITTTVIEQRTVPALDVHRRQLSQGLGAKVGQHVPLDHLAVVSPRGQCEFCPQRLNRKLPLRWADRGAGCEDRTRHLMITSHH